METLDFYFQVRYADNIPHIKYLFMFDLEIALIKFLTYSGTPITSLV